MGLFGSNKGLDKIDRDVAAIADGTADLSHTVGASGSDTAGRVSSNLNRFFSRVRELISHSRQRSVSIAADAAQMNHLVQLTGDAVRRQEVLASDVFESSNRVNQAVGEVAMNSDAIQASTKKQPRPGPALTGADGNRRFDHALDQPAHRAFFIDSQ